MRSLLTKLLFLGAAAVSVFHGPLRIPGAVVSLACAFLSARSPAAVSVIASLASALGFLAQAYLVRSSGWFCGTCLAAEALLAVGGLLCALAGAYRRPVVLALLFLPVLGAGTLAYTRAQAAAVLPVVESQPVGRSAMEASSGHAPEAVEVYFSPWCRACNPVVARFASLDPEGKFWRPLVIPGMALESAKEELKKCGYRGRLVPAPASPCGYVPCIVISGRACSREEGISYVKHLLEKGGGS